MFSFFLEIFKRFHSNVEMSKRKEPGNKFEKMKLDAEIAELCAKELGKELARINQCGTDTYKRTA